VFIKLYHDGRSTIHYEMPNISACGDTVSYNPYNVDCGVLYGRYFLSVSLNDILGKRPLGRPRRRWENNIKIDL
jgi:hypothetical protein